MKWFGRGESGNVEDRRGMGGKGLAMGGIGGIVLVVLSLLFGTDLTQVSVPRQEPARRPAAAEDQLASFSKVILRDTELVWNEQFQKLGRRYAEPTLVLFDGVVQSSCGTAQSAVGPFYCPRDRKVYIDLAFFKDLERKLEAPGEFARAYVIAHEVGHHVQRQLGFRAEPSVATELQADFLAGVWAHHASRKFAYLEKGDIESAINAAFQIGDDRLQKRSQGYVVPDSFTHGSSAQRVAAFSEGFDTGDVRLASKYVTGDQLAE